MSTIISLLALDKYNLSYTITPSVSNETKITQIFCCLGPQIRPEMPLLIASVSLKVINLFKFSAGIGLGAVKVGQQITVFKYPSGSNPRKR